MDIEEIKRICMDACYRVRRELYKGYLEKVYQNALVYELQQAGLEVEVEKDLDVFYRGISVGKYRLDLLVEGCFVIEIKAVKVLDVSHEIQLVNYLNALKLDYGMLVNFGDDKLDIRHKSRNYIPQGFHK